MAGRRYLGVDVGQSSAFAIVADDAGNILGWGSSRCPDSMFQNGAELELIATLREVVSRATAGGGGLDRVDVTVFGLTGGLDTVPRISEKVVKSDRVVCEWDAVTGLIAGVAEAKGIAVIAGTGSTAVGFLENGNTVRCGGWGYTLGDEGSAYHIGLYGIRGALRWFDRRGEETALSRLVLEFFGHQDFFQLKASFMNHLVPRTKVAAFAQYVDLVAHMGDKVARDVLTAAGQELALLAVGVIRQGVRPQSSVVPVGGVFHSEWVRQAFVSALSRHEPEAVVRQALFPPYIGALLLAYFKDGVAVDETVRERLANWVKVHADDAKG